MVYKRIFFIICACLTIAAAGKELPGSSRLRMNVFFKEYTFTAEPALTQEQQARGLMFRKYLGPQEAMIFIFEAPGKYTFWMKNMFIPLDIVWLDAGKKAVFISKNTQPCTSSDCPAIEPGTEAMYVLELNAGTCERIGLKIGDKIELKVKKQ